jgi:hypothetical protein
MRTSPDAKCAGLFRWHGDRNSTAARKLIRMTTQRRKLYESSSGDCWYLCPGRGGKLVVGHEPNRDSGGKSSQIDLGTFLAEGKNGPEHQACANSSAKWSIQHTNETQPRVLTPSIFRSFNL